MSSANIKEYDTKAYSQSKGILRNTAELLVSIILLMLFVSIMYFVFVGNLEEALWNLFYRILEVSRPILAIILFFILLFRGLPLLVSLIESVIEESRQAKEDQLFWERLESPSPIVKEVSKIETVPTLEPKIPSPSTQSMGANVVYSENDNGIITGTFIDNVYDTFEGIEQGSKKAMETYKHSDERKERLAKINLLNEKISKAELDEQTNIKLKEVKNKLIGDN